MGAEPEEPLVHSFKLDTELAPPQLLAFPKFIREHMAFGQLPGIKMGELRAVASPQGHYMEFLSGPDRGIYESTVRVYLDRPIKVEIRSSQGRDEEFEKQLSNVLLMVIQFFEEEARKSILYMAFVPGSPKTAELRKSKSIFRAIFSGNMLNLFMLSILIGVVVFIIMDSAGLRAYAPLVMISIMLALVLSAGRVFAWRSPWKMTSTSREVVVVQHNVPEGMLQHYVGEYREKIKVAKERAYELYERRPPGDKCAEEITRVFVSAGLPADKKDFLVKRVDVYSIVERVAAKFKLSMPTVVISQDPRPNAAATGFTKNLATMIVTIGLLVQLEEDEIELVVGHELSHLRSGDPVVLFSLVICEYLARVYLYWQYIGIFWLPYLLLVFWAIFFFGKFLESRADLEAGLILGKPKVMAESLKKIGFRRLVLEERFLEPGGSRFGEWIRFDPHPPLYFRIKRLEELDLSNPPRHPFLSSIRAVTKAFVNSGKAR